MIKSLFDEDEKEKAVGKAAESLSILHDQSVEEPKSGGSVSDTAKNENEQSRPAVESSQAVMPFEPDEPIGKHQTAKSEEELAGLIAEIEAETVPESPAAHSPNTDKNESAPEPVPPYNKKKEPSTFAQNPVTVERKDFVPESKAQSVRNSGLAYSAAIALTFSVVFMLIMGWFADLLFGFSPWGIVIGIVLGATIGFIQFIRLTSQIINPKPNDFERVSLVSSLEEPADQAPDHIPSAPDPGPPAEGDRALPELTGTPSSVADPVADAEGKNPDPEISDLSDRTPSEPNK